MVKYAIIIDADRCSDLPLNHSCGDPSGRKDYGKEGQVLMKGWFKYLIIGWGIFCAG